MYATKSVWQRHCSVVVHSLDLLLWFSFTTFVRGYVVYSLYQLFIYKLSIMTTYLQGWLWELQRIMNLKYLKNVWHIVNALQMLAIIIHIFSFLALLFEASICCFSRIYLVFQRPQDAKAAFIRLLKKILSSTLNVPGSVPGIGELSTMNIKEKKLGF